MNEQLIGDLFAEATRRMTGSSSREFSQKFAELIVRECLVQVNEVYTSLDNKDKRVGAQSQLMWGIAGGLTPADINNLAAYTATLK